MKVSVIIPAYKPAHLSEALASVFAQCFTDYEIVVVNDGSPHAIREILLPLAEAGRIRYFEQENRGMAAARNRGLQESRGDYVAYLDDDDYWPADKLEWQVSYLEEHSEVGVLVGDAQIIEGDETRRVPLASGPKSLEDLFSGSGIMSPGQTLIRRSLMIEHNGFDENVWGADDYDLWLALARKSVLTMVSRIALYYRRHPSNASRDGLSMCLNHQRVLERHLEFVIPDRRPEMRLVSARELFRYLGAYTIREWKRRVLHGDFRDGRRYLSALTWFVKRAASDRRFLTRIFAELMPARLTGEEP